MEELKKAVETADKFNDSIFTNTPEMVDAIQTLIDLAERVLALEKKEHIDWNCGDTHCVVCEDRGWNACREAILK